MKRLAAKTALFISFVMLNDLTPAFAHGGDRVFECEAIGDGNYVVTIARGEQDIAWAKYTLGGDHGGTTDNATKLELREGNQYIGQGLIFTVTRRKVEINDLGSDTIVPCRLTKSHSQSAEQNNKNTFKNIGGRSLGGRIRSGPGTDFRQTGSLAEATPITIIANTGVTFDGYDWFEIAFDGGTGFQWGGIMCSTGQQLPGIFEQCR